METKHRIILLYYREGLSIRKIARPLNIHRNIVKARIEVHKRFKSCSKSELSDPGSAMCQYFVKGQQRPSEKLELEKPNLYSYPGNMECFSGEHYRVDKYSTVCFGEAYISTEMILKIAHDKNFMRQYYDVYCLLGNSDIQAYIGTPEYLAHKAARIKGTDNQIPIRDNPALLLNDSKIRESFKTRYQSTSKLYYNGQPAFEEILTRINLYLEML